MTGFGYPYYDQQARQKAKEEDAIVEVVKKDTLAEIEVLKAEKLEKCRSDVKAAAEMQKTIVLIGDGGRIELQRERFGDDLKGTLPVRLKTCNLLVNINAKGEQILYIIFTLPNNTEANIVIKKSDIIEKKVVHKKFIEAGVVLGFREKKEVEMEILLLSELLQKAPVITLYDHHGWNKIGNKWTYVFPDITTWEEMIKCI